ncbi:MAG: hypothetical protein O8C61_01870 [Candidatus Methanoperedens sp.]|nr:hypothetical protein [Candidatus Methanoperedens sp.]
MKGIYKIGIVILLLFTISSASATTQIGDNITIENNVTAKNFIGNLSWEYLLGIPADITNLQNAGYVTNATANFYSGNYSNLTNVPTDFPNSSVSGLQISITNLQNSGYITNETVNFYSGNYNNLTNKPTDFPNSSVSGIQTSITTLQNSGYVTNATANFYSGNYSNLTNIPTNFPNTSLANYLLILTYGTNFPNSTIGTYGGDFPNSTISAKTTLAQVNSSAQIGESQVTGLVTDLGNKLNTATYGTNFPNSTIGTYGGDFPNSSSLKSVLGTANRINVSGGNTIDIATNWIGQAAITTVGTITTGTWQGTAIADAYIASASIWNAKTTLAEVNQSANLYNVNGANITSGSIAKSVMPANIAYNDSINTFGSFNQSFDTNTLFIDAVNHRVGIGKANPDEKLSVNGTTEIYTSTGGTALYVSSTSGNVGIGTASPGNKLDVIGTVNASFLNGDGSNISNINGSKITSGKVDSSFLNITNISSYLSGDKTASGNGLYVVGPNITNLPAGTWFLNSGVTVSVANAGATCNMSQNTSGVIHVISSGEETTNTLAVIHLSGVISLSSPDTVQVACAALGKAAVIKAAVTDLPGVAGNTASYIIALRIG